jgi:hypothetical protein
LESRFNANNQLEPWTNKVGDSYCDRAHVTENDPELDETTILNSLFTVPSSLGHPEGTFPVKLHCLLSELERNGLDNIVPWQLNGRCFVVHKQQQFAEKTPAVVSISIMDRTLLEGLCLSDSHQNIIPNILFLF